MGDHTAALQPADSDSDSDDDDDDDDGDDSQSTAATPTTTSTAPHTAADAAADRHHSVMRVSWHRARGSRWYSADTRVFARAVRIALLLWTRVQCAVATSPW